MTTSKKHRICFGMTLYNNAKYLPEAIESLLGQTYEDFHIVAVDDCSTDETEEIMKQYEARDKRIFYFRNEKRACMITTWRSAFYKTLELHNPDYFAWASDHDKWHPEWLEHHINTLAEDPRAVLAYPETVPISTDGEILPLEQPSPFETSAMSKLDRFYNVCRHMEGAGNKIYGLFRVEPLIKAGVFRYHTMPDKLLITEISIFGTFKYIPRKLWYRRYFGPAASTEELVKTQLNKLFEPSSVPFHAHFPHIAHTLSLLSASGVLYPGEDQPIFWSRLLLSMIYWESNRGKNIKRELTDLNNMLQSVSEGKETFHPSLNFLQLTSLPGIERILSSLLDNKNEPVLNSDMHSILNLGLMILYHHANSEPFFKETKQANENCEKLLEKLAIAQAETKRAGENVERFKKDVERFKKDVERFKKGIESAKAEAEHWKQHATSRFGYAFVTNLKKIIRKDRSD